MSDRRQEERIKFFTETLKALITLFLALTGGIAFLSRVVYSEKNTRQEAFDKTLLVMGTFLDILLIIGIFGVWLHIKREIKKL